jgi:hypothetical protein
LLDAPMREAMGRTDELARAHLVAPQAVRLGAALGGVTLSVSELAGCLRQ